MKDKNRVKGLISLVCCVLIVALVAGLVIALVGGLSDTFGEYIGSGDKLSTTIKPDGTTETPPETTKPDVDVNCQHTETEEAANGNTYCSECNLLIALKAPSITGTDYSVSWTAVAEATSYDIYVNAEFYYTTSELLAMLDFYESGTYIITVKARTGAVTSSVSNTHTIHVLSAPQITLSGDTISWSTVSGADAYYLYTVSTDGKLLELVKGCTADVRSIDLTTLGLYPSVYKFALVADGEGYRESAASNIVSYQYSVSYAVSTNIVNGTTEDISSFVAEGGSILGFLTPDVGYSLPDSITVYMNGIAANYAYNSETGLISVPNVTGDVVINATCQEITYTASLGLSGCDFEDFVYTASYGGTMSVTIVPNKYCVLPETVTVTMGGETLEASAYTYDSTTGVVTVPNITGDVRIEVICSETLHAPEISVNGGVVSWSPVSTADSYRIYANGVTVCSGYKGTVYDFNSTLGGGSYVVKVKSYFGATASEDSNEVFFDVLRAPVVTLSDDVISWSAIDGAETYFVYREDSEGFIYLLQESSARSLDLGELNLESGTHEIFVYACGTGYVTSQYSNTVSYTVTSTFTAPTISNATNATLSSDQAFKFYYPKLSGYSAYSMMSAGTLQLVLNGAVVSDGWYWGTHASYSNCEVFSIDTSACISGMNSCYLKFTVDGQTYITNTLTFTCAATTYSVSADLTGGTISAPTTLAAGETLSGTLSASSGYTLPSFITVKMGGTVLAEGTDYTYDSANGAFSVSGVSGNIEIIAVCAIKTYSVSVTVNNGTKTGFSSTVNHGNTLTGTISANTNYEFPASITVRMGDKILVRNTDYTYNSSTGRISISNVTGNVVITATCSKIVEEYTIEIYGNSNLLASETYTGEYYYSFTSEYPDVSVFSATVGGATTTDYELYNYGDNQYEILVYAPATGDVVIYIYL